MKRIILFTFMILSLNGCSTLKEVQSTLVNNYAAQQKLSAALQAMEQGKSAEAISILERIISAPGVNGVTDEALFHLSLLKLSYEDDDGSLPSVRYLERLRRDYRDSNWARQAKPLLEFLKEFTAVKRQNRNLKILNMSLTKDNKDMHQNIERLKNLDMQLERRSK
jgi:hypothetical protein